MMTGTDQQLRDVRMVLWDGGWHTLDELARVTGHPQASISARLRDLRKAQFGHFVIERQHVERGLWRYRMVVPT